MIRSIKTAAILLLALASSALCATYPPYYGVVPSTSGGTAAMYLSGTDCVAASSTTAGTCAVSISGPAASVTATMFVGPQLTSLAASSTTAAANIATLFTNINSTGAALTTETARAVAADSVLNQSTITLTGLFVTNASSATNTSPQGILVKSSVTASAFFGDISHTTGAPATDANLTGPVTSVGNATSIPGPVPTSAVDLSTVTTALALKAPLASPAFTGTVTAPAASISSITATGVWGVPTRQVFLSGSGTYTTPTNPKPRQIRILMVGGGGGASGGGNVGTAGSGVTGGDTTFGGATASGGTGGENAGVGGSGAGGTATFGTLSATGFALQGGTGGGYTNAVAANYSPGGQGGASCLGGNGGIDSSNVGGKPAATNTGGGGGGGSSGSGNYSGGGGGAGGCINGIVNNPAATYSYGVGAAGAGGAAGTSGTTGAAGGSGIIMVDEIY